MNKKRFLLGLLSLLLAFNLTKSPSIDNTKRKAKRTTEITNSEIDLANYRLLHTPKVITYKPSELIVLRSYDVLNEKEHFNILKLVSSTTYNKEESKKSIDYFLNYEPFKEYIASSLITRTDYNYKGLIDKDLKYWVSTVSAVYSPSIHAMSVHTTLNGDETDNFTYGEIETFIINDEFITNSNYSIKESGQMYKSIDNPDIYLTAYYFNETDLKEYLKDSYTIEELRIIEQSLNSKNDKLIKK